MTWPRRPHCPKSAVQLFCGRCPVRVVGVDMSGGRLRKEPARGYTIKYTIMPYGSQDYDTMEGKATGKPAWTADDFAAMGAFMEAFNQDLVVSGEFVDGRGLAEPVHTRRMKRKSGLAVVTDGP